VTELDENSGPATMGRPTSELAGLNKLCAGAVRGHFQVASFGAPCHTREL